MEPFAYSRACSAETRVNSPNPLILRISKNNILWGVVWNISYIELRIVKSTKPWSLQLWTQFKQLRIEAWKSQDFNGVWPRDLAIPARRSNQLNYEATDVGSWSFVGSNNPVRNECDVINKVFYILNCGFWNQVCYDHRSYERNLSNCV